MRRVGFEHERRGRVHDDLEPDEMHREEQQRSTRDGDHERGEQQRHVERDEVTESVPEVVEDAPSVAHRRDDR